MIMDGLLIAILIIGDWYVIYKFVFSVCILSVYNVPDEAYNKTLKRASYAES